jgi:hypothetical protein
MAWKKTLAPAGSPVHFIADHTGDFTAALGMLFDRECTLFLWEPYIDIVQTAFANTGIFDGPRSAKVIFRVSMCSATRKAYLK